MKENKKFRKDNLHSVDSSKRVYKMYKKKKNWVVAPVVFALLAPTMIAGPGAVIANAVEADTVTESKETLAETKAKYINFINGLEEVAGFDKAAVEKEITNKDTEADVKKAALDAVNQHRSLYVNPIVKKYNDQLETLNNLTVDEKNKFETEIKTAEENITKELSADTDAMDYEFKNVKTTVATFESTAKKTIEAAKIQDAENGKELQVVKDEAIKKIQALKHLSQAKKDLAISEINKATNKEDVKSALEGAIKDNEKNLENAVKAEETKVNGNIDNVTNDDDKTLFKEKLKTIENIEDLEEKLIALQDLNAEIQQYLDQEAQDNKLNEKKKTVKDEINSDSKGWGLKFATIKSYTDRVDAAKDIAAVDAVKADWDKFLDAYKLDHIAGLELDKAKEKATSEINKLQDLTTAEKVRFTGLVKSASSPEKVVEFLKEAQALNTKHAEEKAKELADAKKAAIKEVNALTSLTEKEKTGYVKDINQKETLKEIKNVLVDANLQNAKNAAIADVTALKYLSLGEKQTYIDKIKAEETNNKEKVEAALQEAIDKDWENVQENKELSVIKQAAKEKIAQLAYLTKEERDNANKAIDAATEKAVIIDLYDKYKEINDNNKVVVEEANKLTDAKNAAKKIVDELVYLSQSAKKAYKAEIDAAASINAVEVIQAKAELADKAIKDEINSLTTAQTDAIDKILTLKYLSATEKADFVKEVSEATSVVEVEAIQFTAETANVQKAIKSEKDLAEAKNALTNFLNGKDHGNEFTKAIDEVKDHADLQEILNNFLKLHNGAHDEKLITEIETAIKEGNFSEAQTKINELFDAATKKEYQAKLDAAIQLENAKSEAFKTIDGLNYSLTSEQKDAAKEKVAKMTSVEAIEKYVAELVKEDNKQHDAIYIELAELQIKTGRFEDAAKTIEKIRDKEEKERLTKLLEEAQADANKLPRLQYQAHVRNKGWMKVGNIKPTDEKATTIGTTGEALPMEALVLSLNDVENSSIQYRAHVRNIGWQEWTNSGYIAGTTGKALSIENLQFKLTGEVAKKYSIEYRAHVRNLGWQKWVKDGKTSGTTGKALPIEALQIRLVEKEAAK